MGVILINTNQSFQNTQSVINYHFENSNLFLNYMNLRQIKFTHNAIFCRIQIGLFWVNFLIAGLPISKVACTQRRARTELTFFCVGYSNSFALQIRDPRVH